jgi:hypothetical protein
MEDRVEHRGRQPALLGFATHFVHNLFEPFGRTQKLAELKGNQQIHLSAILWRSGPIRFGHLRNHVNCDLLRLHR